MTVKEAIVFLQFSQDIGDLNKKLMEGIKALPETDEDANELLQASKHLILAQTNILKAANK